MNKLCTLPEALERFVEPGMHLSFSSTPSRSNAAVRELARAYRGRKPEWTLSATGFHSTLHVLARLRLGRRYIGCFFGDNYPSPRPNRLYAELMAEGYDLEAWSLWAYVSALAAGAFGHPYAFSRSLAGTSLGEDLRERGKLFEVPDPQRPDRRLALVRALRPDVTFLHAPLGDPEGNVAFAPPHGEGFHGALAAQRGAIVTVERIVPKEVLRRLPHLRPLPAHRVLAVCEEPFGAHPQPLHVAPPELAGLEPGYGDDYDAYQRCRSLSQDDQLFASFSREVLEPPDGAGAYRAFVGSSQLEALRELPGSVAAVPPLRADGLEPSDELLLLAGRALARRIVESGHDCLLAGIGQAFAACRLAKQLLASRERDAEIMIETGFADIDVERAHPFLLSRQNVASAGRLTSIDNMLGALCCGGTASCIGVIGAGEIDTHGNVNSSVADGVPLVGPGGAPDIAASASELLVLTRADPRRLVGKVEYVTSLGHNVRTIVTEACVFERESVDAPWLVRDVLPTRALRLRELLQGGFRFAMPEAPAVAAPPTDAELAILARLRVSALHPSPKKVP
jgi:acyl CoA:acetate/3-ketoacid CoA transferase alpha subunit/acyl CoA:acetate/3-ketoacid CoA transferase beta subunit